MTVAAVILASTPDAALADAAGQPAVRRIADLAWSGGALPIVVVAADPDGAVLASLAGASAGFVEAVDPAGGAVGQLVTGAQRALADVSGTTAVLAWPARMAWVGPESVTSLIEAHGTDPAAILRPAYRNEPGWPALVPIAALAALGDVPPTAEPGAIFESLAATGLDVRSLDLGDPGTVRDVGTARADLPPYEGPTQPASGHVHEWGADVAADADDLAETAGIAELAADEGAPPRP